MSPFHASQGESWRQMRLAGIEMFGDRSCAVMEIGANQTYSTSGAFTERSMTLYVVRREHWGINSEGVYLVARDGQPFDPPLTMTHLGLKAGETIEPERMGQGPTLKCLGEEEVKVKAGTFKAIKTRMTWRERNGDPKDELTTWFAKGVGLVKQVVVGDESYTLELERFHADGEIVPRPVARKKN